MDSTKVLKEAMTAYEAVYNQDLRVELEEKQAFENWVNSLVEEGYDLSEYTWEDMYGIYTSESLIGDVLANRGKIASTVGKVASGIGRASNAAVNQLGTSTRNIARTAKNVVTSAPVRAAASGFNRSGLVGAVTGAVGATAARPSAAKPPATPATKPVTAAKPPATPATKPAAAAKPPATPATKPAATTPTARPATSATARPTAAAKPAAAPASKPAPTASATPSSATPAAPKRTFNPLMQKTFGYQTGYAPDQVKGDIKKMAQMGSLKAGFDLFDVVKGHLLDEGYADTEEAALAIMANMSEEWRDSIISEAIDMISELTGGKGHPGYKAGSKDHGPMQVGHPADTFKRTMKGGTMSQRHGDHLGDLDDDDDEDDLEAGLKDTARKKRENVRKPLRSKVRAARKALSNN